MTLLITIIAAVISTAVWYTSEKARKRNAKKGNPKIINVPISIPAKTN